MAENETVLYEWLKSIDPKVLEEDRIPLAGYTPAFPWDDFSKNIAQAFQTEKLNIKKGEVRWHEADRLSLDLGDRLFTQGISLSTYEGKAFFVIDLEDLRFLMYALLTEQPPTDVQVFDEELEEGFYRYLSLEAVRCFSEIDFDQNLSPHLLREKDLPDEPMLGIDIHISFIDRKIVSRLLIDSKLLRSWREHFSDRKLSGPASPEFLKKVEVPFHLEVGKVELTQKEVKSLEAGDLILLDQCYVDPGSNAGQVILTYNGKPKIRASLEKNHIKIMESPLFHEDSNPLIKGDKDDE